VVNSDKFDLAGNWQLSQDDKPPIPGFLPGSTYLAYMANGMPDPFWGMNETAAAELAHHHYTYARTFTLPAHFLAKAHVDLVAQGLDTLCTIALNGTELGKTNNIYRTWRLDAKPLLQAGENTIEIRIENPFPYMAARQKNDPLPGGAVSAKGATHLRKTPCHFGWDWGPALPPAGLVGSIALESYETRITDLRVRQIHREQQVNLEVTAQLLSTTGSRMDGEIKLRTPEGEVLTYQMQADDSRLHCLIAVDNPQLWWCNGLGGQPLYHLTLTALRDGETADIREMRIGLRTIELDTSPDKYGAQFRFIVNGAPIFAKGANWIPVDSFITRVKREDIDFYIDSARRANMNMLRVWGGGMYESEDFYDACDRNGILVWQDFIFACGAYPLHDQAFLDNVHAEVADNVRRIRHRACLALWCGNNENEYFAKLWRKGSKAEKSNLPFYHHTLREWVNELDGTTPYWPGSPSAGGLEHKLQSRKTGRIRGDSHLWQIWHGMMPVESFRKLTTRFCSEFGMESMPSLHTVRAFTDQSPNLFDPVMQLHQKSIGGNEKMLFYLLAKYRNPARFEDFVYLSQLVQADTVRFATDCWRRNIGLTNGALFWQFNDCWPVASWAGIDYHRQWKAVTYQSRHFNKLLCLSNDYFKDRAELYVINERNEDFSGTLEWTICDFYGNNINGGTYPVSASAVSPARCAVLSYKDILKGHKIEDVVLIVKLINSEKTTDEKSWLLAADKYARLPRASLELECTQEGTLATVIVSSPVYARSVFLEAQGVTAPWSDNFFDIPAGRSVTVTVPLPEGMDAAHLKERIKVKSLADVKPKNGIAADKRLRFLMMLRKKNWGSWLIFKLV